MKKIIITFGALLIAGIVYAQTISAPSFSVPSTLATTTRKILVPVTIYTATTTVLTQTYTLRQVDLQIANAQTQINNAETRLLYWQNIQAEITPQVSNFAQ